MDLANKALCYALRNPPPGQKKAPYKDILKVVVKTDGLPPTQGAMSEAAASFMLAKGPVGRPKGWRKTTLQEDRKILSVFKKLRPPGAGIDSRVIHQALPAKLKKKVVRKTIIRRLSEKGYNPERKIQKSDPGPALSIVRERFCKVHADKTPQGWKAELQGCGDFKEFNWYPEQLYARFTKLRAPWTYMTKKEKRKPAFVRPKRWFARADYKKTRKQKVFGLTASTGNSLAFLVPKSYKAENWAADIKKHLKPFLKKEFPTKTAFQILLDGEKLLHAPVAKMAMAACGISVLPNWPKYSPDLNPQENVWPWAEKNLRGREKGKSPTFTTFQKQVDLWGMSGVGGKGALNHLCHPDLG